MSRKVALHNLGCKVNSYETEYMAQAFAERGYDIVPFREKADIYIVNTCTVTNIADRKSRQMLHRARKTNPAAIVVAAGCYVQADAEKAARDEDIDLLVGNNEKKNIVDLVEHFRGGEKRIAVRDINDGVQEYETLALHATLEHTRACIKVQDGCNQFCSYCLIPYVRGRIRSRAMEDVCREVKELAEKGYREFVLTGIHLSSYGKDWGRYSDGLAELIEAVAQIRGVERIRLGSLEPRIVTEPFVKRLAAVEQVCPHFHLSMQSGCGETLRRMNRHYTPEEYAAGCGLLRQYFDDPAITTDIIVGFPGETDAEFAASARFTESIGFYETHIFKYSPRKGTVAASMDGQVPEDVKNRRSAILLELSRRQQETYLSRHAGQTAEVLFEEKEERRDGIRWTGFTPSYIRVAVMTEKDTELSNVICPVKLDAPAGDGTMTGTLLRHGI